MAQNKEKYQAQLKALQDKYGDGLVGGSYTFKGLKTFDDLSDAELQQWESQNENALKKYSNYTPAQRRVAAANIYNNQLFMKKFNNIKLFNSLNKDQRMSMLDATNTQEQFEEHYGNDSNFAELNSLSIDAKKELFKQGYPNDAVFEHNTKALTNTIKFNDPGYAAQHGNIMLSYNAANLSRSGYDAKEAAESVEKGQKEARQNQLKKITADDLDRKNNDTKEQAHNIENEYLSKLQNNEINEDDVVNEFDSFATRHKVKDQFGGTYEMPGSRYYQAFKNSDELNKTNFPIGQRVRIMSQYKAMQDKYGDGAAQQWLENTMQTVVSDNQSAFDWGCNTAKNIWTGGVANIMNKLNGINNIAIAASGEFSGEGAGKALARHLTQQAPSLEKAKGVSGTMSALWERAWDPKYWEGVDQYNTFDVDEINRAEKNGGISQYQNITHIGEEMSTAATINEALKMTKFLWSDYLMARAMGAGSSKATSLANKLGTGFGNFVSKASALGTVAASGVGISESYGMQTFNQTLQEANARIDELMDSDAVKYADQMMETDSSKQAINNYFNQLKSQYTVAAKKAEENGSYLQVPSDDQLMGQAQDAYRSHLQGQYKELYKDNYKADRQEALNKAADAYMVDATIEEVRMGLGNYFFKNYLFSKNTKEALRGSKPVLDKIKYASDGKAALFDKAAAGESGFPKWVSKVLPKTQEGKEKLKMMATPIFDGFQSNYLDDVTVAFGKGFGLGQFNNYFDNKYNPEKAAFGTDMLSNFCAGLKYAENGAMSALADKQSFYDGFVGALGSLTSFSPNLLPKARREAKEAMGINTPEAWKSASIMQKINALVTNPILSGYYQGKSNMDAARGAVEYINNQVAKNGQAITNAIQTISAMTQMPASVRKGQVRGIKDSKAYEALQLGLLIRQWQNDELLQGSPLMQNLVPLLDDIRSGKLTDEQQADLAKQFNGQPNNDSKGDPAKALETIKKNVDKMDKMVASYDKATEDIQKSVKKSKWFETCVQEMGAEKAAQLVNGIATMQALNENYKARYSKIMQQLGMSEKRDNKPVSLIFGTQRGAEIARDAIKDNIEEVQKKLDFVKKEFEVADEDSTDQNEITQREKNRLLIKQYEQQLMELNEQFQYADQIAKSPNMEGLSIEDSFEDFINGGYIDNIAALAQVVACASDKTDLFTKEQKEKVRKLVAELEKVDPDAIEKISDAAVLENKIKGNEEAMHKLQSPDNILAAASYMDSLVSNYANNVQSVLQQKAISDSLNLLDKASAQSVEELTRVARMTSPYVIDKYIKENPQYKKILEDAKKVSQICMDSYEAINNLEGLTDVEKKLYCDIFYSIADNSKDADDLLKGLQEAKDQSDAENKEREKNVLDEVLKQIEKQQKLRDSFVEREKEVEKKLAEKNKDKEKNTEEAEEGETPATKSNITANDTQIEGAKITGKNSEGKDLYKARIINDHLYVAKDNNGKEEWYEYKDGKLIGDAVEMTDEFLKNQDKEFKESVTAAELHEYDSSEVVDQNANTETTKVENNDIDRFVNHINKVIEEIKQQDVDDDTVEKLKACQETTKTLNELLALIKKPILDSDNYKEVNKLLVDLKEQSRQLGIYADKYLDTAILHHNLALAIINKFTAKELQGLFDELVKGGKQLANWNGEDFELTTDGTRVILNGKELIIQSIINEQELSKKKANVTDDSTAYIDDKGRVTYTFIGNKCYVALDERCNFYKEYVKGNVVGEVIARESLDKHTDLVISKDDLENTIQQHFEKASDTEKENNRAKAAEVIGNANTLSVEDFNKSVEKTLEETEQKEQARETLKSIYNRVYNVINQFIANGKMSKLTDEDLNSIDQVNTLTKYFGNDITQVLSITQHAKGLNPINEIISKAQLAEKQRRTLVKVKQEEATKQEATKPIEKPAEEDPKTVHFDKMEDGVEGIPAGERVNMVYFGNGKFKEGKKGTWIKVGDKLYPKPGTLKEAKANNAFENEIALKSGTVVNGDCIKVLTPTEIEKQADGSYKVTKVGELLFVNKADYLKKQQEQSTTKETPSDKSKEQPAVPIAEQPANDVDNAVQKGLENETPIGNPSEENVQTPASKIEEGETEVINNTPVEKNNAEEAAPIEPQSKLNNVNEPIIVNMGDVVKLDNEGQATYEEHAENNPLAGFLDKNAMTFQDAQENERIGDPMNGMKGSAVMGYNIQDLRGPEKKVVKSVHNRSKQMQEFDEWCEENNINYQKVVDTELGQILERNPDTKVFTMMTTQLSAAEKYGALSKHVVFEVIKVTPEVEEIHKGDDSIVTFNNAKYLVIGVLGYNNENEKQKAAYLTLSDKIRQHRWGWLKNNKDEGVYVFTSMYTHIDRLSNGLLVQQTESDTESKLRPVSELLEEERNPQGFEIDDLKWIIQEPEDVKKVGHISGTVFTPSDNEGNNGNVFLLVPTANGNYAPAYIKPVIFATRVEERSDDIEQEDLPIKEGELKNEIDNLLMQCTHSQLEVRKQAICDLVRILNMPKDGPTILVGNEQHNNVTVIGRDGEVLFQSNADAKFDRMAFNQAVNKARFRVNINTSILSNKQQLVKYDEAGCLMTDVAYLGTMGAVFSTYFIDQSTGQPIVTKKEGSNDDSGTQQGRSDFSRKQTESTQYMGKTFRLIHGKWQNDNHVNIDTSTKEGRQLEKELNASVWLKSNPECAIEVKGQKYYYIDSNNAIKVDKDGKITFATPEQYKNLKEFIAKQAEQKKTIEAAKAQLSLEERQAIAIENGQAVPVETQNVPLTANDDAKAERQFEGGVEIVQREPKEKDIQHSIDQGEVEIISGLNNQKVNKEAPQSDEQGQPPLTSQQKELGNYGLPLANETTKEKTTMPQAPKPAETKVIDDANKGSNKSVEELKGQKNNINFASAVKSNSKLRNQLLAKFKEAGIPVKTPNEMIAKILEKNDLTKFNDLDTFLNCIKL